MSSNQSLLLHPLRLLCLPTPVGPALPNWLLKYISQGEQELSSRLNMMHAASAGVWLLSITNGAEETTSASSNQAKTRWKRLNKGLQAQWDYQWNLMLLALSAVYGQFDISSVGNQENHRKPYLVLPWISLPKILLHSTHSTQSIHSPCHVQGLTCAWNFWNVRVLQVSTSSSTMKGRRQGNTEASSRRAVQISVRVTWSWNSGASIVMGVP